MSGVKNIVNIQDNRLDFDIASTNKLKFIFRGQENFRLSEVDGTSHVHFIAQKARDDLLFGPKTVFGTNADFMGRISNIDNHHLKNLLDVEATNPVKNQALIYDDNNKWDAITITSSVADKAGDAHNFELLNSTFKIDGKENQINTEIDSPSTSIKISLTPDVHIDESLVVGTNPEAAALVTSRISDQKAIFTNNIVSGDGGIHVDEDGDVIIPLNADVLGSIHVKYDANIDSILKVGEEGNGARALVQGYTHNRHGELAVFSNDAAGVDGGIHVKNDGDVLIPGILRISDSRVYVAALSSGDDAVFSHDAIGELGGIHVDEDGHVKIPLNAVIDGNLTVNGTQTIINTEIKLIEDPLIELGYTDYTGTANQDIGFFGQYTEDNYAGLYYDKSDNLFKIFDSLGTASYESFLGTSATSKEMPSDISLASIKAKKFISTGGDFGQIVKNGIMTYPTEVQFQFDSIDFKTLLINDVYGTNHGFFSGKALIYFYRTDHTQSSSILFNYSLHSNPPDDIVLKTTVEIESRTGTIPYINFDSDGIILKDQDFAGLDTGLFEGTYKLVISILPIVVLQSHIESKLPGETNMFYLSFETISNVSITSISVREEHPDGYELLVGTPLTLGNGKFQTAATRLAISVVLENNASYTADWGMFGLEPEEIDDEDDKPTFLQTIGAYNIYDGFKVDQTRDEPGNYVMRLSPGGDGDGFYGTIYINYEDGNPGTARIRLMTSPDSTPLLEADLRDPGSSATYVVQETDRRQSFFFVIYERIPADRNLSGPTVVNGSLLSQAGGYVITPFEDEWDNGEIIINFSLND